MTRDQLVAVLDEWVGRDVSVRVVSDGDDLIAVFQGRLLERSVGKEPALFWPLDTTGRSGIWSCRASIGTWNGSKGPRHTRVTSWWRSAKRE
jgi:hypothetical protein